MTHAYTGLYGDPISESNRMIVRRAKQMVNARQERTPLAVTDLDAASSNVWEKRPLGAQAYARMAPDPWTARGLPS